MSSSGPTRVTSDASGADGDRTTRTTLPGGRELRSGVDVEGHVVSLTPPGQSAHAFEYGRRGVLEAYRLRHVRVSDTARLVEVFAHELR